MPAALMECGDFTEFQEALKNLRRTDDCIVNTINSVVTTDSFHEDRTGACKDLYTSLEEGNNKRERIIRNCIQVTADRVKKLKEQRSEKADDIQLSKSLRSEQTKLKMLQVELTVEHLIKERTMKVFNEKCRKYFKP